MCWENVKFEFVMLSVPQINTGWRRLAVIIFKYCDDQMLQLANDLTYYNLHNWKQ